MTHSEIKDSVYRYIIREQLADKKVPLHDFQWDYARAAIFSMITLAYISVIMYFFKEDNYLRQPLVLIAYFGFAASKHHYNILSEKFWMIRNEWTAACYYLANLMYYVFYFYMFMNLISSVTVLPETVGNTITWMTAIINVGIAAVIHLHGKIALYHSAKMRDSCLDMNTDALKFCDKGEISMKKDLDKIFTIYHATGCDYLLQWDHRAKSFVPKKHGRTRY